MGGRHEYGFGLDKEENRKYRVLGMIDGIKVLIPKDTNKKQPTPTPTYSNTSNTQYIVIRSDMKLKSFYFYEGKKLVRSVDFDHGKNPHVHIWKEEYSKDGKKTPGRNEIEENHLTLSQSDWNLYNKVKKFLNSL